MGMNCQILDKSISSLSTINKITDHDMKSMGSGGLGMQASHDYIGPENKEYMEVYSLTLAGLCKYILSGVWGFILTKLGWWSLGV